MWCKNCNIETNASVCPVCNATTSEDVPVEVFWCSACATPIIHLSTAADKGICPICGGKTKYMASDLRPVFPEERLLLALLLDKEPAEYMNRSVWAVNSRYYIDEETKTINSSDFDSEIDLMLLELDDDLDENPFGEEVETEDNDELDNDTTPGHDEYEFDDVDPEIFRDAALMVKWLQKHDQ